MKKIIAPKYLAALLLLVFCLVSLVHAQSPQPAELLPDNGNGFSSPASGGVSSPPSGGIQSPPAGGISSPPAGGIQTPPAGGSQQPTSPKSPTSDPKLKNPLSGNASTIGALLKLLLDRVVLPIGSVIAVLYIMYAGFLFVTAGGDEGKVGEARHTFTYAVLGAIILLGAWVIESAVRGTINQLLK